jgi:hypothetical protein
MSEQDPKRLLEGGGGSPGSGDLRSLLEAGRSEMPDHARLAMLAVKMGIVGGLGGAGAAGAAGAGSAGGGGAGGAGASAVGGGKAVATAATAVKVGMAAKVIGVIAVASAAGAGAVVVANRQVETQPKPAGMVAMPRTNGNASADANANASANAVNAPAVSADAGSVAPHPSRSAPVRTAASSPPAEVRDEGPEAEVKLVQRAQDALRGSRPAEALALCNDHAKRFPNGMVTQECEVIAVEALVKTGRKDEARRRADRFKARFPGSASIRRLDVLLGD